MPFSPEVKAEALIACGRRCCICHKFCGVRVECHHIIPAGKGGGDNLGNCIPLCLDCHAEVEHYNPQHPKGNKFGPEELKGHRDNWHRLLRESIITGMEKDRGVVDEPAMPQQKAARKPPDVSEQEIVILCALAEGRGWAYELQIVQENGINLQRAKFYLEELHRKGLVVPRMTADAGAIHSLSHEGRRFLIENNLIG